MTPCISRRSGPVDREDLTGQERCAVGGEEGDHARHVVGGADPADRHALYVLIDLGIGHPGVPLDRKEPLARRDVT
jgi:hypothetical protein